MGRKLTLEIIKDKLKSIDSSIEVLSDVYERSDKPLKCKCQKCGDVWFPIWDNLKQGKGCNRCKREKGNKRRRMKIEDIIKRLRVISPNIEVVSDEYISDTSKLSCRCTQCNETFNISWHHLQRGQNCPNCTMEKYKEMKRSSLKEVKEYIRKNDLPVELLSKKYTNAKQLLKFKCLKCNEIFNKRYDNLKSGQLCTTCGIKKRSGTNHPLYNPFLTDEERNKSRILRYGKKYQNWCYEVHKKHKFSCKVCNTNRNIVAHHLYSYSSHENIRLEVNNGVTLCQKHHIAFHKQFGYRNNTKEQFEEYMKHAQ